MAYTTNDKILAAHYNNFRDDVNDVYADNASSGTGEGSGGFGYGQTPIPPLSPPTKKVEAAEWNALLGAIQDCAGHQGSGTNGLPASVAVGQVIAALDGVAPPTAVANIASVISTIRANRFNIDPAVSSITSVGTDTATGNWDGTRSQQITAAFSSWDEMRYFFNAGGKIVFSFNLPGTASNTTETNWQAMSSAIDNVLFDYTSTTSSGGVGSSSAGFYDLTNVSQQIYSYIPSGYSSEEYRISANLNAPAGAAVEIVFDILFVTPAGGDVIDLNLVSELSELDPNDTSNSISVTAPTYTIGSIS